MTLRSYQTTIETGKLYEIKKMGAPNGVGDQLIPNLSVLGNTINIYGAQVLPVGAPLQMTKDRTAFEGIIPFDVIPNYIYLEDNSGTPDNIIISGIQVTEVV